MDSNIIFKPIPNSTQEFAIDTRANETLLCGTRGGGKTIAQIMAFAKYIGAGYGEFWRGVIVDKSYKGLDDVLAKTQRYFPSLGGKWKGSKDMYMWVFPTGESLLFRSVKDIAEANTKIKGQEFPFIGINELTNYPTDEVYRALLACNRSGFIPSEHKKVSVTGREYYLPPIPLIVFPTTNPDGAGRNWVKAKFIDVAPYGKVIRNSYDIKNEDGTTEKIERSQVAIFSSFKENPYIAKEYEAILRSETNPVRRKAWLEGSWDIVGGTALGEVWDTNKCVIPRFKIPSGWYIDRSFDWGSSHPYSICWWAEANGEEVEITTQNGKKITFCPPRGSLIQFYEDYGTEKIGTNKGVKRSASEIAQRIVEIETSLVEKGYIQDYAQAGSADNQIWNGTNNDYESIGAIMERYGVTWERSNKGAGSRANGLALLQNMLGATKYDKEEPRIYFMDNCVASINTLPLLELDHKGDVDTNCEDHVYDAVRYRITHRREIGTVTGFSY